jgi:hypothetical protein
VPLDIEIRRGGIDLTDNGKEEPNSKENWGGWPPLAAPHLVESVVTSLAWDNRVLLEVEEALLARMIHDNATLCLPRKRLTRRFEDVRNCLST